MNSLKFRGSVAFRSSLMLKVLLLLLMEVVRPEVGLADSVSADVAVAAVRGRGVGAAGCAERVGARSDVVLRQARVHRAVASRRLHLLQRKRM